MQRQRFSSDNTTDKTRDGFAEADNAGSAVGIGAYDGEIASEATSIDAEQSIELEQYSEIERFLETEQSAEVQRITEAMRIEVRAQQKRNIFFTVGSIVAYIPYLMMLDANLSNGHFREGAGLSFLALFMVPTLLSVLLLHIYNRKVGKRTQKATGKIDALEDLTLVGPLAEVLAIYDPAVRRMAKAKLTQLLPQLKASDAALLSAAQRRRLNLFLGAHRFDLGYRDIRELWSKQARQRDLEFQLAILKAYEQVGDADCLPAVRTLTHPAPHYAKSAPPELVEEARHCLEFLEKLVEQNKVSKQLLRASSMPEAMPDTLLRAAMPQANPEESNSLLRAADA